MTTSSPAASGRSPALTTALCLTLLAGLGYGVWSAAAAMVVNQAVNEGRAVADMSENVGRWASQYGGVHVRTVGAQAKLPGSFLTRSTYTASSTDATGGASGHALSEQSRGDERKAMESTEFYYWKNPALVQRELSDVVTASGSRLQYRMTARTVLNPNNAASAQELQALDAIQATFDAHPPTPDQPAPTAATQSPTSAASPLEHWTTDGAGRLVYARAVVAQASCLKCHDTPDKAPEFLRTNAMFNGGGGFGYVAGRPVGIVSVTVPLPDTWTVLRQGLPAVSWLALLSAAAAALGLGALAWRGRPTP